MNPAKLLAAITARAKPFQPVSGDFARITNGDILHALGSIKHKHAGLLVRIKYAGQYEFLRDLEYAFWVEAIDIAYMEGWKYPKHLIGQEFYRNLARLAIVEHIDPHICLECGGTGTDIEDSRLVDCGPCHGVGRVQRSDRSRARIIGMSWEGWRDTWSDRYHLIQSRLDLWESIACGSMKKRLATC